MAAKLNLCSYTSIQKKKLFVQMHFLKSRKKNFYIEKQKTYLFFLDLFAYVHISDFLRSVLILKFPSFRIVSYLGILNAFCLKFHLIILFCYFFIFQCRRFSLFFLKNYHCKLKEMS